jgi:serpin B
VSTGPHFQRVLPALILVVFGMTSLGSTRSAFYRQAMQAETANALSSGNNQFAFDLFKSVASAAKNTNVFFSPVSISTALAMAYAGSRGETQKQLADVLHFSGTQEQVASGFQSLLALMAQPANGAYQLQVANALWAQQGVHLQPEFVSVMHTYYSGNFRMVDFAQTATSRATINRWVAYKTAGKISQLLQPDDIDARTRLVLTNAVYFKGKWTTPFEESLTRPDTFTAGDGTKKQVPFMHRIGHFRYVQAGELQVLELPYRGDELSMLVLLPSAEAPDPWAGLSWTKLQQLQAQMKSTNVALSLPKFKIEARLSLAPTLSDMGMPDAFDQRANFSGMTDKEQWLISAVVHEAVVDVNEKGTEAAAATGITMRPTAMFPGEPVVFRADHPFLYIIIHKPSNSILFLGRLSNPPQ